MTQLNAPNKSYTSKKLGHRRSKVLHDSTDQHRRSKAETTKRTYFRSEEGRDEGGRRLRFVPAAPFALTRRDATGQRLVSILRASAATPSATLAGAEGLLQPSAVRAAASAVAPGSDEPSAAPVQLHQRGERRGSFQTIFFVRTTV
jgi:hypothetical protein